MPAPKLLRQANPGSQRRKTWCGNTGLFELSDQFEDIEHRTFDKDGFEDAEKTISNIESSLGLADLGQFTRPHPPRP